MPLLSEIAIDLAVKQRRVIDNLLVSSPFLSVIPSITANKDISHSYEELESVTGLNYGDEMDGSPTAVDAKTALKSTPLSWVQGDHVATAQAVKQLGGGGEKAPGVYLSKKLPSILKKSGMNTEGTIVYNWEAYAQALNNYQTMQTSAASSGMYSILIVRLLEEETCMLTNPNFQATGELIEIEPYSRGGIFKDPLNNNKPSYGWYMNGNLGLLNASTRAISSINNIDATHVPTDSSLDTALEQVYSDQEPGNITMVMRPEVKNWLGQSLKFDKVQASFGDTAVNTVMDSFNGVPIITTRNMSNSEAAVSDPS
jgi:hypothetical protein